ncbi:MAG: hypothetical protein J7L72_12230 [Candidatus Aminicenantes bacterium]|nr:hypothetical protein [Candidatus Aminicenantes bacterium]
MKTDEKEVSVRADVEKNRLYTTLKGVLTEKDIAALHDDLRREAGKLKPGYIAISDVREYNPSGEGMNKIISKTMEAAVETGVGKVIRIVSGEGGVDMQNISKSEHGYEAVICRSPSEAEKEADILFGDRTGTNHGSVISLS